MSDLIDIKLYLFLMIDYYFFKDIVDSKRSFLRLTVDYSKVINY